MDLKLLNSLLEAKGISTKELTRLLVSAGFLIKYEKVRRYLEGLSPLEKDFKDAVIAVLNGESIKKKPKPLNKGLEPSELLSQLIIKHGLSNAKLAKMLSENGLKTTGPAIGTYRRGEVGVKLSFIKAVFELLGEDYSSVLNGEPLSKVKSVPIVGDVSCGAGAVNVYQDVGEVISVSEDIYKPSLRGLIASGDSMQMEICNGDIVIIDEASAPQHGDLCVYRLHGELACKIFIDKTAAAGVIELKPMNANPSFKTRTIRLEDDIIEDLELFKVVMISKSLKGTNEARLKRIGEF